MMKLGFKFDENVKYCPNQTDFAQIFEGISTELKSKWWNWAPNLMKFWNLEAKLNRLAPKRLMEFQPNSIQTDEIEIQID